ncbi:hypothetical protein V1512DRAFT_246786 [Lipomyces arxii]|uniref:uncharacterized protein n=1 Tax=Lipomyces arxii TaxID=56418 RepID=UPI0034CF72E0
MTNNDYRSDSEQPLSPPVSSIFPQLLDGLDIVNNNHAPSGEVTNAEFEESLQYAVVEPRSDIPNVPTSVSRMTTPDHGYGFAVAIENSEDPCLDYQELQYADCQQNDENAFLNCKELHPPAQVYLKVEVEDKSSRSELDYFTQEPMVVVKEEPVDQESKHTLDDYLTHDYVDSGYESILIDELFDVSMDTTLDREIEHIFASADESDRQHDLDEEILFEPIILQTAEQYMSLAFAAICEHVRSLRQYERSARRRRS